MSSKVVSPALRQLARAWPVDGLRPTIQLGAVLDSLATSEQVKPRTIAAVRALAENRLKNQASLVDTAGDH